MHKDDKIHPPSTKSRRISEAMGILSHGGDKKMTKEIKFFWDRKNNDCGEELLICLTKLQTEIDFKITKESNTSKQKILRLETGEENHENLILQIIFCSHDFNFKISQEKFWHGGMEVCRRF